MKSHILWQDWPLIVGEINIPWGITWVFCWLPRKGSDLVESYNPSKNIGVNYGKLMKIEVSHQLYGKSLWWCFCLFFFGGYLHWRNYLRATRKLGFLDINPLNCTPWPAKTGRDTGKSGATTWPVASCSASHACCWCYLFDIFLIYFDIRILVKLKLHASLCGQLTYIFPSSFAETNPKVDAMLFPSLFDRLIDLVVLCDLGVILVIKKTNVVAFTLGKGALFGFSAPPGWNSDVGPAVGTF